MVAVRFWKLGLGGLLNASDRKVIGSRRNRYFSSSLLFVSLFQCSVALEVIPALKVSKGLVFICTCEWMFLCKYVCRLPFEPGEERKQQHVLSSRVIGK